MEKMYGHYVPNKRIGKGVIKSLFIVFLIACMILDSIWQSCCAKKTDEPKKKKKSTAALGVSKKKKVEQEED